MNGQVSTIGRDKTENLRAQDFYAEILALQKVLDRLKAKVLRVLPVTYGNKIPWEKEIEKGKAEIRAGKSVSFNTIEEMKKYFGA